MFVTAGDVVMVGAEVYAHRSVRPRMEATLRVSRFARTDTSSTALLERQTWFDRSRTHADAGVRVSFMQSRQQSLAVHVGPSVRWRQDLKGHTWSTSRDTEDYRQFVANEVRACAQRPECVSRTFVHSPADTGEAFYGFMLASDARRTNLGGFGELDYRVAFGRVWSSAYAGGRAYAGREKNDRVARDFFTWHAGVRVGASF